MLEHFSIFQPNAWDNSIAPIDLIHKIINQLNAVIDEVNNMSDESYERSKEYTDIQIATVNSQITTVNQSISSLTRSVFELNNYITSVSNTSDTRYQTLVGNINQLTEYCIQTRTYCYNYTDVKVLDLKNYLEAQINEIKHLVDNLLDEQTIDGMTGTYKTVREILGTKILQKTKQRGGNRYALTWGQLSLTDNKGWLCRMTTRYSQRINLFAPTWYNFMRNNYTYPSHIQPYIYTPNLNTWGAFSNVTLLFIGELIHKVRQYYTSTTAEVKANYQYLDCFNYDEWQTYISDGTPIPTIENLVDMNDLYDSTNDYMSLVWAQFKTSIGIFTGFLAGNGLYSSSATSTTVLFAGSGDLPYMFQYMLGNLVTDDLTQTFN